MAICRPAVYRGFLSSCAPLPGSWGARRLSASVLHTGCLSEDLLLSVNQGWGLTSKTHEELVDKLVKFKLIDNKRLVTAFRACDRKHFVISKHKDEAYENKPLPLYRGATISTPQHHAQVMNPLAMHLRPGSKALDIGCGSGYLTAVMAEMIFGAEQGMEPLNVPEEDLESPRKAMDGLVVGVDITDELCELTQKNLVSLGRPWSSWEGLLVRKGEGKRVDLDSLGGPFDCIHVGAAEEHEESLLEWLLPHLKPGGRIIAPVGPSQGEQELLQFDKPVTSEQDSPQRTVIMRVLCQPLKDSLTVMTPAQELADVRCKLKEWEESFSEKMGRKPKREELFHDEVAGPLFKRFTELNRRAR